MDQFFFSRFSGHNLRLALFVYRLIGATFIEISLMIPSLNKIEISVKGDTCVLLGVKELRIINKNGGPLPVKCLVAILELSLMY